MPHYRIASLYAPGQPTVTNVDAVHSSFLTLYASFLWRPRFPYGGVERELTIRVATGREGHVKPETFAKLMSARLTEPDRLVVGEIAPLESFMIDFSGIGDAIDAAAEVADPLRRQERRERLRHQTEMNKVAEDAGVLDNELKSVELTRLQIQTIREMVDVGMMSESDARIAIKRLLNTQDETARQLERDGVRVLQVRVDPGRDAPPSDEPTA